MILKFFFHKFQIFHSIFKTFIRINVFISISVNFSRYFYSYKNTFFSFQVSSFKLYFLNLFFYIQGAQCPSLKTNMHYQGLFKWIELFHGNLFRQLNFIILASSTFITLIIIVIIHVNSIFFILFFSSLPSIQLILVI